jgi:hypothetical protein
MSSHPRSLQSTIRYLVLRFIPAFARERCQRLIMSGYFDGQWYLKRYPDVAHATTDPAYHFLLHGAHERRDPGPDFSTTQYVLLHPELVHTGENPILHFLRTRQSGDSPPSNASGVLVNPSRDRELNRREAAMDISSVKRSNQILSDLLDNLPSQDACDRTPKIFHFIYGFEHQSDFPYYADLAIRSALYFNPGYRAYYYTRHPPTGPYWANVADNVEVVHIQDFEYYGHSRLSHYAHKADVVRLLVMNRVGGIYLDIDTITRKSYDELLSHDFVMGVQASGPDSTSGVANAVLIGKPQSHFTSVWLRHYDYFRSRGRDALWDYHSVKLPVHLMSEMPEHIHIVDYRAFFYPLWHSVIPTLFTDEGYARYRDSFSDAFCFHLWNGATHEFLSQIDEAYIRNTQSIYAEIAREVEGLT